MKSSYWESRRFKFDFFLNKSHEFRGSIFIVHNGMLIIPPNQNQIRLFFLRKEERGKTRFLCRVRFLSRIGLRFYE